MPAHSRSLRPSLARLSRAERRGHLSGQVPGSRSITAGALLLALLVPVSLGCREQDEPARGGAVAETGAPTEAATAGRAGSSRELRQAVTVNGLRAHEKAFQAIARANGGNRAAGTPGYDASARYVSKKLKSAGYRVTFQEFPYRASFERVEKGQEIRPTARDLEPEAMEYSPSTPARGIRAKVALVPLDDDGSDGCEARDFARRVFRGAVALVRRGVCRFSVKATNASRAGALAIVIYNQEAGRLHGTLGAPENASIPTVGVTREVGEALRDDAEGKKAEVFLNVQTVTRDTTTRNVLAEIPGGREDHVIMAGAHLDSVEAGPGLNDNGSGSAALLEIALHLQAVVPRHNVRFAFWGAEEAGLIGSRYYVNQLARDEIEAIAAYVNLDMVGSRNYVRFVYDGGGAGSSRAAQGSEAIEKVFVDYFKARHVPSKPLPFSGGSDHAPFAAAGIPVGGLFTGASGAKTAAEARRFGGVGGKPYDACYHERCDTLANVSLKALHEMADATAHALVTLATGRVELERKR